jgi:phage tail-like protein
VRGITPQVPTPRPLIDTLPGLYQDDPVTRAWTAALDDLIAPVFLTLDSFPAYLDPRLAPEDFVPWLASWVGITLDPSWPLGQRRAAIAGAAELYRWRGTARGVTEAVELATGVTPELSESGTTTWSNRPTVGHVSAEPTGDGPPPPAPHQLVRLRVPAGTAPDLNAVRRAVDLAAPAHVPTTVEVVVDGAG